MNENHRNQHPDPTRAPNNPLRGFDAAAPAVNAIDAHILRLLHRKARAPACRPAGSSSRRKEHPIEPHLLALADTIPDCYWLDRPERPTPNPALLGLEESDLVIAGGDFTGLWAALQAKQADPCRDVVLLEAKSVGDGASGRNGGFAEPSLTHGRFNGLRHFPTEIETLERLGVENYRDLFASLKRHAIEADTEENGTISVATAPYQVAVLLEHFADLQRFGGTVEWLDRDAVRARKAVLATNAFRSPL